MSTFKAVICMAVCLQCIRLSTVYGLGTGSIHRISDGYVVGGTFVGKCYTSDNTDTIQWIKISKSEIYNATSVAGRRKFIEYNLTESGGILYPFNNTGRYSLNETIYTEATASFQQGDKVSVLTIKDLQDGDAALIKCKIDTYSGTFNITVFSPVLALKVFQGSRTTPRFVSGSIVNVTNSSDLIGCEVTGGRYTPTLNVTLDGLNLATTQYSIITFSGISGLTTVTDKIRKLASYEPSVTDNGKNVTCSALPHGTRYYPQPVLESVVLKVQGAAHIDCKGVHPTLTCNVTANPSPFCGTGYPAGCSVTWTWKNTSIEVQLNSNTNVDGYLATAEYVDPLAERYVVTLTLPNTQSKVWPTFTLNVTNAIGSNTVDVIVTYSPSPSTGSKAHVIPPVLHGLLTVAILLCARNS